MTEIVGIRFRGMGKTYFFDPCGEKFREGDRVVVETASGTELGEVAAANQFVDDEKRCAARRNRQQSCTVRSVRMRAGSTCAS